MDRVWNGYGSGYGSGHAIWAGFPAMAVKEESGVFLVWSSSTRARQSRNRRNCNHSATIEVQEAPSGTRTGLTSLQGKLAVLLVASQLVAFVQLPEAHGGSEPAPAAGAGPAAEATAVAAAPGGKMTSNGSSSSSSTEAAEAASGGSGGSSRSNGTSNGSSSTKTRSSIRIKSSIGASISLSSTRKGYGSGVWIRGMDHAVSWGMDQRYGSGGMDCVWVRGLDPYLVF